MEKNKYCVVSQNLLFFSLRFYIKSYNTKSVRKFLLLLVSHAVISIDITCR